MPVAQSIWGGEDGPMAIAVARVYKGDLGEGPPAESRGRPAGQYSPEAESLLAFGC